MPLSIDTLARLVDLGPLLGRHLAAFAGHEMAEALGAMRNCTLTHGCCEVTRNKSFDLILSHCGEGPDSFYDDFIYAYSAYSEYWAPVTALAGAGLCWTSRAALDKLFSPWLRSDNWVPPTVGGAFPRPVDEAAATPPSDISPDELHANQQYDIARQLTAWRKPGLPQADADISRALIVHLSNTPRASDLDSWHIVALCGLLAHGLDFQLNAADEQSLRIIPAMPSLIRRDEMFGRLHDLLVPDWASDAPGAPTFSVHPVDVQLFDPEETTDDLEAPPAARVDASTPAPSRDARKQEIRETRERLTDTAALARVRSRVVSLIAASVRNDCGIRADWQYLFNMQMSTASVYLETCTDVLERIGNSVMADVSTRDIWKWHDAPAAGTHGPWPPSMPMHVAQWLARVLIIEAGVQSTPAARSASGFAAMARMDTPPALVIGSMAWGDLVKGVEVMGNAHWHASFDTVSRAGKTGVNPMPDASGQDAPEREASTRWQKPKRAHKSRHKHGANWRHA
ncbi:hypothetical protein PIN31115_03252 [Pandoraea iniqua]|uniref:Uncharacterized protein n=1 Tax=Pandoraea iniqua TaxID=2508288 RepID=A0A5E4WHD4_9BURK|nr:hypothetical protein [Pandoraea iniqua]VVE23239.1 hypothetical protein PIN31115_03252 [Pandoraea iniqua]